MLLIASCQLKSKTETFKVLYNNFTKFPVFSLDSKNTNTQQNNAFIENRSLKHEEKIKIISEDHGFM